METQTVTQRLSSFVRARLLFKREIEIDAVSKSLFEADYLDNLISTKENIDQEMNKVLVRSVYLTVTLYLVGIGSNTPISSLGIDLSSVPGILIFLSFASAYSLSLAIFSFLNSQTYGALVDQVILHQSGDGLVDPDLLKASLSKEWMFFKLLRRDFNIFSPCHIQLINPGKTISRIAFVAMTLLTLAPFVLLIVIQPYLTIAFLPETFGGTAAKTFSLAAVFSATAILVISQVPFRCTVELVVHLEDKQEEPAKAENTQDHGQAG